MRPRTIWNAVVDQTERARSSGALQRIVTRVELIEDREIPFLVHVLSGPERKLAALDKQGRSGRNPFLPPDPDLWVGDISPTHVCVLNKFNVVDHHLLIVTRDFADQNDLLTLADFEALVSCMADHDVLGFYNAGTVAGASQKHKHLQLIPLPLGPGPEATPVETAIAAAPQHAGPSRVAAFPFRHGLATLDGAPIREGEAPALFDRYLALLRATAIGAPGLPYNLLLTRRWMLLVPRAAEHFDGISINALGFAGSLLVRNQDQLGRVRRAGPLSALQSVAPPFA